MGRVGTPRIKKANIERSFGYAIFPDDRNPSRDTVLQLVFGFDADVELAQSLLRDARHSPLYSRVPRYTAISYGNYYWPLEAVTVSDEKTQE